MDWHVGEVEGEDDVVLEPASVVSEERKRSLVAWQRLGPELDVRRERHARNEVPCKSAPLLVDRDCSLRTNVTKEHTPRMLI